MFNFYDYPLNILKKEFVDQIMLFERRIVTISGGVDSTATVLALKEKGVECELLWNDTRKTLRTARKTISELLKITGWNFHVTYPYVNHGELREKCVKAIREIENGSKKYSKNLFPCCYHLKEKPLDAWIRNNIDTWNTVIICSIAGYESHQRQIRLGELRNKGTYLRFKRKKYFQAYPWRDYTSHKHGQLLQGYVDSRLGKVAHSGCNVCPVLTLFDIPGEEIRTEKSRKVYAIS